MILFYKMHVMKKSVYSCNLKKSDLYCIAFIEKFNIEFALIGKNFCAKIRMFVIINITIVLWNKIRKL